MGFAREDSKAIAREGGYPSTYSVGHRPEEYALYYTILYKYYIICEGYATQKELKILHDARDVASLVIFHARIGQIDGHVHPRLSPQLGPTVAKQPILGIIMAVHHFTITQCIRVPLFVGL